MTLGSIVEANGERKYKIDLTEKEFDALTMGETLRKPIEYTKGTYEMLLRIRKR